MHKTEMQQFAIKDFLFSSNSHTEWVVHLLMHAFECNFEQYCTIFWSNWIVQFSFDQYSITVQSNKLPHTEWGWCIFSCISFLISNPTQLNFSFTSDLFNFFVISDLFNFSPPKMHHILTQSPPIERFHAVYIVNAPSNSLQVYTPNPQTPSKPPLFISTKAPSSMHLPTHRQTYYLALHQGTS